MPYDKLPYKKLVFVERGLDKDGRFYLIVKWESVIPNVPDIVGFNVYRAWSPLGPYELLNSTPITQNFYLDRITLQKAFPYYKVAYISASKGEEDLNSIPPVSELDQELDGFSGYPNEERVKDGLFSLESRLKWITLEQMRRLNWLLYNKGEVVYYLLRRRFGNPCPKCFEAYGVRSGNPDCPVCFGTGFEKGYDVYKGRLHIATGQEKVIETAEGFQITYPPSAWMTDYPIVRDGDIVVRISDGNRYRIEGVNRQVQQGKLLIQRFTMHLLEETHPIYQFNLNP